MAAANLTPYGCIYLITNTATGKRYVGQTTGSVEERWRVHCSSRSRCKALSAAIAKHGEASFIVEQLCTATSQVELNRLEAEYVVQLGTLAPAGYNLKHGGGSKGKWSEAMLAKLDAARSRPQNRERSIQASVEMWKRPETRRKISDAIRRGLAAPDVRARRSAIAKAVCNTEEVRSRMSQAQKRRFENPAERGKISANNKARAAAPEYRAKMSAAAAKIYADPEQRARVSRSMKKLWEDPEYRARMIAAISAGKARLKQASE